MTSDFSSDSLSAGGREYVIGDSEFLVLVSDRASNFVYANAAYCKASGYSWQELKGTLTNRMLHPDLPPQVVADMIATLKRKRPWTGIIKNQRKNGDYYWVRLNLSPLYAEDNQYAGGLLVHSKVSREEIAQYEPIYRAMREGRDANLVLHHGEPFRRNLWGRLLLLSRSFGLRGLIWGSVIASMIVGAACMSLLTDDFGVKFWALLGAFGVVTAAIGLNLGRAIIQPLGRAVRFANDIAAGSLSAQLRSSRSDEIGDLLRALAQMNVNMRATVADVRDGVGVMQSATANIAAGTTDLSDRTESQSRRLQTTAASTEEMTANVKHTADASQQASENAHAANTAAEASGRAIQEVATAMAAISGASKKIADIVGVIDSIAFQTNILALNAAVEAARAGEQGRGFAVVAAEVRSLAQRSAQSAKEIRSLIADSVKYVEDGALRVNGAGKTVADVVVQVRRVTELVATIADALVEQQAGIGQINDGVNDLELVTQQNAAMVHEHTAAAASLREQAELLAKSVSVFKLSRQENQELFNLADHTRDSLEVSHLRSKAA